jgi:serine protease inhibitor ecotin
MKTIVLLAALALASPAWAQAPAAQAEAVKPVPKAQAAKARKALSAKRQQDARHCLQRASNDAIIRCAEEYL